MASDFYKIYKGLNIRPNSGSLVTAAGDFAYNSSSSKFEGYAGSADSFVQEAKTQTLTNKTIDADSNTITNIDNADIKSGAAIAYSKLNLTGAILNADLAGSIAYSKLVLTNSIVNADINSSAAIAYSKLNLATSIVNGDIAVAAAIARSKLASGTASHVLINDGSGVMSSEATLATSRGGTNLDTSASTGVAHVSSGAWSVSNVVNADVDAAAAIARTKLASGTASHVVINDGSGVMSSEASLAVTRGGTGAATLTSNNVILGNGTSAVQFVAPSTTGNVLQSNGTTWVSASAPAATQYLWIGMFSGGQCNWNSLPTYPTYGSGTLNSGSTTTKTELKNTNFGTVTVPQESSKDVCGISFTVPATKTYEVIFQLGVMNDTPPQKTYVRMHDGTNTLCEKYMKHSGETTSPTTCIVPVTLVGYYYGTASASATIKIQGAVDGGNGSLNYASETPVYISIRAID